MLAKIGNVCAYQLRMLTNVQQCCNSAMFTGGQRPAELKQVFPMVWPGSVVITILSVGGRLAKTEYLLFIWIDRHTTPQLPPVSQIWWLLPGCLLCCSISRSLAVGWNYANVINTKSCWGLSQAGNELFILQRSTLTTLVSQLFWWKISTARFKGVCVCAGGAYNGISLKPEQQNESICSSADQQNIKGAIFSRSFGVVWSLLAPYQVSKRGGVGAAANRQPPMLLTPSSGAGQLTGRIVGTSFQNAAHILTAS